MQVITGTTKLLGIIGDPIKHSLSPVMQNAAIAYLGVDAVYVPFRVAPEAMSPAIAGLSALGIQGFNVTIPHKQAVLPFLTEVTAIAQAVGAVNTVWRTEAGWSGTNTDVAGFLAPLKALDRVWSNSTALILGNGGAARAVVAGCAQLGFAQIQVVGRDRSKLQAFLDSWQTSPIPVNLSVHGWEELPQRLPGANLVVNTTPIGMAPQRDASPLTDAEMAQLPTDAIAYDLIYTPRPTHFLHQAERRGLVAWDGTEMLVQQGAAALEIWLQQPAPVDVMRQALLQHLATRSP